MAKQSIKLLPVKESITLTPSEWRVIAMFYEYPDLSELKAKFNVNTDQLYAVLKRLEVKKAIKIIQTPSQSLVEIPSIFWERLEKELSKSIGPIASLILDDKIEEFNKSRNNFPRKMLYSLVEKVATEIDSPAGKQDFQKTMLELIKQY
ncbi:MAG: hypothetical protein DRH93_01250 [Deltaproteobacteria bacterium]|nr:MAG: hypothetical protein DRH93_01250 [Deltaproteobacteria bacterium]